MICMQNLLLFYLNSESIVTSKSCIDISTFCIEVSQSLLHSNAKVCAVGPPAKTFNCGHVYSLLKETYTY